ncbi:MAG: glycosyltransferase family 39 protein, partial [Chloroflexota bacterium]
TPYTYAYEEAPLGTFILGGWGAINGDYDTFGFPINSGRALMLAFHLMSVALVYSITKAITGRNLAALIAVLIFMFSPLATIIQRRVLLDNVMLPFLLASIYFLVGKQRNLYHYMLSATFFGVAVLIRGSAVYLLPALYLIARTQSDKDHRRFAVNLWSGLTFSLLSILPLYAQMRLELFPQGWLFSGDFPHVSLIERMLDRGPDTGFILNIGSGFRESFAQWTEVTYATSDPIIVYGGILCVIITAALARYNRHLWSIPLLTFVYAIGLAIGGRVVISDVLILLPLFAIATGIVVSLIVDAIGTGSITTIGLSTVALCILLYPFYTFYTLRIDIYTDNETQDQIDAVEWVRNNIDEDALIVTDNYAFVALRSDMPNVHYYWKVDTDPDIKFTLLDDDHCNIDYVITTQQVVEDIDLFELDLVRRAVERSTVIREYDNQGWPVEIHQVSKERCDFLADDIELESDEPAPLGASELDDTGDDSDDGEEVDFTPDALGVSDEADESVPSDETESEDN